ncbi:murein hydrolase activator EnvC family protein [Anaeromyxobacter soli]|uniref:murein hydrolase activator EnvC family protein n=1 Tax=Anaeromyxobacter soli TaxID=2922725 RepID=UPI001FB02846|nr:peptidoglycan DD-metalloendopeptidase family protein [Anaeromyxobacter sp. SG29]
MPAALALALALAAADPRAQLSALEARRRAEETAARLLAQQERSVLDTLGEAETALTTARAELRRVEAERAEASAGLAHAREVEAGARARLRARLAELRPRLAARARMGPAGELRLLLASASLADLVKRSYLMDRILSRDAGLLADAQAAAREGEAARAERAREAARLDALAGEAVERRTQAEARREERETLLTALRSARGFHERAAREAATQARRLADFVATLPPPRVGSALPGGFAARRGRLPAPTVGAIAVGFGRIVNPKFNTVTVQNGLDIAARAGAPVRSVAPGRVVHAGWFKGYGNLVIVEHGEGYHTLFAHLGAMQTAMGEVVDAGAVLGTVGDSGSLKGPYLYFELRERGRPVDPRPWLAP